MTPKTKAYLSLLLTLIPLLMALILISNLSEGSSATSERHWSDVLLFVVPVLRFAINIGWVVHLIRQPHVGRIPNVFWTLGLMLEGVAMYCFGVFLGLLISGAGFIALMYWYFFLACIVLQGRFRDHVYVSERRTLQRSI